MSDEEGCVLLLVWLSGTAAVAWVGGRLAEHGVLTMHAETAGLVFAGAFTLLFMIIPGLRAALLGLTELFFRLIQAAWEIALTLIGIAILAAIGSGVAQCSAKEAESGVEFRQQDYGASFERHRCLR